MNKLINKIANRLAACIWSSDEKRALAKLRKEFFGAVCANTAKPLVVAIDGMVNLKFQSLFYILLLQVIQHQSGRRVEAVVFTAKRLNTYFTALRIYKIFFKTHFVSADTFLQGNDLRDAKQLIREITAKAKNGDDIYQLTKGPLHIGRDIYNTYLRTRLVGSVEGYDEKLGQIIDLYLRLMQNK